MKKNTILPEMAAPYDFRTCVPTVEDLPENVDVGTICIVSKNKDLYMHRGYKNWIPLGEIDSHNKGHITETNCPNCGAPIDPSLDVCPYCKTPYIRR